MFGNQAFQISLKEWASISQQKRANTISIFLKLKDNKCYKSIIPFTSNTESFTFNDFKEMKKLNDKWVAV